ncbi:hypothetical protein EXIGLDRAFT_636054 [Exidia glandulosa HHB12029]|uniref:Vacuolar membrane protein n=1 Tax=Exidia glandulosa HHB12029 TaxID=1314781 RepID=A0A165R3X4_EXIGL|nr:hypothetical protein EXIGLDRAFT_636054 [Exidia glandulosa HHB12029]
MYLSSISLIRDLTGLNASEPLAPAAPLESPVDDERCRLLGPVALVVQGLLGVLVILSLVYKRNHESPKRKWRIWLFDVSKQVVGQVVVHIANVSLAALVGHVSAANPCAQYFIHVLLDTTVGVALLYAFLRLFTYLLVHKMQLKGFETGQYGDPPSLFYWSRQAAVYIVSLLCMKIIVLLIVSFLPFLSSASEWLLSWLSASLQVIFVMGIFPIVMNILQFWIVDTILKASAAVGPVALDSPFNEDEEREPIFAVAGSDDEDGGDVKPAVARRPAAAPREHSYPPTTSSDGGTGPGSRAATPIPGAVAPPPPVPR